MNMIHVHVDNESTYILLYIYKVYINCKINMEFVIMKKKAKAELNNY